MSEISLPSPERLSAVPIMYGLRGRMELVGSGQDVLNINNRKIVVSKDLLGKHEGEFQKILSSASTNERKELWKQRGGSYAEQMDIWKQSVVRGVASHQGYFSHPEQADFFKNLGLESEGFDASQADALYKKYFTATKTQSQTEVFTQDILQQIQKPDGTYDAEKLSSHAEGIRFMASIFGKDAAEIIMQKLSAAVELKNNPDAFITHTKDTVNTINPSSQEEHLVVYLSQAQKRYKKEVEDKTITPPVAPKKDITPDKKPAPITQPTTPPTPIVEDKIKKTDILPTVEKAKDKLKTPKPIESPLPNGIKPVIPPLHETLPVEVIKVTPKVEEPTDPPRLKGSLAKTISQTVQKIFSPSKNEVKKTEVLQPANTNPKTPSPDRKVQPEKIPLKPVLSDVAISNSDLTRVDLPKQKKDKVQKVEVLPSLTIEDYVKAVEGWAIYGYHNKLEINGKQYPGSPGNYSTGNNADLLIAKGKNERVAIGIKVMESIMPNLATNWKTSTKGFEKLHDNMFVTVTDAETKNEEEKKLIQIWLFVDNSQASIRPHSDRSFSNIGLLISKPIADKFEHDLQTNPDLVEELLIQSLVGYDSNPEKSGIQRYKANNLIYIPSDKLQTIEKEVNTSNETQLLSFINSCPKLPFKKGPYGTREIYIENFKMI